MKVILGPWACGIGFYHITVPHYTFQFADKKHMFPPQIAKMGSNRVCLKLVIVVGTIHFRTILEVQVAYFHTTKALRFHQNMGISAKESTI